MLEYAGKLVLAPMVRVGELPVRLLSLKYGADLVWGPEIIDKKILQCQRVENTEFKTIDFIEDIPGKTYKDERNKLVFRTFPEKERGRVVFQMGTASADMAVQAAKVVARDVDAIDVNSGCPKHFSVHSGMGAGLLKTPDKLVNILERLVKEVGGPYGISISVKIRILDTVEETLSLVRRLVTTGINCLTVHCRTTPMRPREPVIRDALGGVAQICRNAQVACYVNGDVEGRWQLKSLVDTYGVSGAMIARAAETNASCFSNKLVPWQTVAKDYLQIAAQFNTHDSNTKYCLLRMIPGKEPVYQKIARARSNSEFIDLITGVQEKEKSSNVIVSDASLDSGDKAKALTVDLESEEKSSETRLENGEKSSEADSNNAEKISETGNETMNCSSSQAEEFTPKAKSTSDSVATQNPTETALKRSLADCNDRQPKKLASSTPSASVNA